MTRLIIGVLAALSLYGQTAIYEDFSGPVRGNNFDGNPLYKSAPSSGLNCHNQVAAIVNGVWQNQTLACGTEAGGRPYNNIWAILAYPYNNKDTGFWRSYMKPGETWNPRFNRFSARLRCDHIENYYPGGNLDFGTYVHDVAVAHGPTSPSDDNNWHFYHTVAFNMTPFRWVWLTFNEKSNHQRGRQNSWDQPVNGTTDNPNTVPYYDSMVGAYLQVMNRPGAEYGTCHWDDMTFSVVTGEPDYYVSSISAQYTGTRYEVAWNTPSSKLLTYELRLHTSSMKTAGWSAGTDLGTKNSGASAYTSMQWVGTNRPAEPEGLYFAIRPRMKAQAITAGEPTTAMEMWGHGLQVDDEIYCTGLTGLTPSSFTTTVSSVVDWKTITVAQATSGAYTPYAGYCRSTSETSRFTEVFIPPDPVSPPMAPISVKVTKTTPTTASLSWTPDPFATSTIVERRIAGGGDWETVLTTTTVTFTDSNLLPGTNYEYRLRGKNAVGTSDPNLLPVRAETAPPELVNAPAGRWSGAPGYELSWRAPDNVAVEYEVRLSTAGSLKTLGFSNGLCKNGTTTCDSQDRVSAGADPVILFRSATMAQAPNIWWAIKPVSVPILGTTGDGQNPTWIVTPVEMGVSGGDRVTVSGVGGNSAANQTDVATVDVLPWQTWQLAGGTLSNIFADGAGKCSANLTVPHNLLPGWKVNVYGSTSSALSNGQEPKRFTVTGVTGPASFDFECPGVVTGTYASDYSSSIAFRIQAFPGVAIPVAGNGPYAEGGSIFSTEENKNFIEIQLFAQGPPIRHIPHRPGGRLTSSAAIMHYQAPDTGACTTAVWGAAALQDAGGMRSRTQVLTGLAPGTSSSYILYCGEGAFSTGDLTTPPAAAPALVQLQIAAAPPETASGVDNLVVEYGERLDSMSLSVNTACSSGTRCAVSFPHPADSILWVRRRWCTNRLIDPECSNPAHELARSEPEAISVVQ